MRFKDYLEEGLGRILSGPTAWEWKGKKWTVLDYKGNKAQLGTTKSGDLISKVFGDAVGERYVTKWVSLDKLEKEGTPIK